MKKILPAKRKGLLYRQFFLANCFLMVFLLFPNGKVFSFSSSKEINFTEKNQQEQVTIKGTIKNENGEPLPGVTVLVKGTKNGTYSDFDGKYSIVTKTGAVLVFSYIGYKNREILVGEDRNVINVDMAPDVESLKQVVVTGFVKREKDNFTGASTVITGEEVIEDGAQNVIQSISRLDPSIILSDNIAFGSDPNVLPTFRIRGESSINLNDLENEFGIDPNLPLFILDGFKTTLRTVVDLDPTRIKTITILKDAASTASYGSQAANGVIVIETKVPEFGKMQVGYSSNIAVESPDLSVYNLMNARQKLDYEILAQRWTALNEIGQIYHLGQIPQLRLDAVYNDVLYDVKRGVNNYWLHEPVQLGYSTRHSINLGGGAEAFRYGVNIGITQKEGVIKESENNSWNAGINLTYRKNKINVRNQLTISRGESVNSNYGSFADYARANPYFVPRDEEGNIVKYLDINNNFVDERYQNPLYRSTLASFNNSDYIDIRNNLSLRWNPLKSFWFTGSLSVGKNIGNNHSFTDPLDFNFDNEEDFSKRGSYTEGKTSTFTYTVRGDMRYAKAFGKEQGHRIDISGRAEVNNNESESVRFSVEGFPVGSNGAPSYAFGYADNSRPNLSQNIARSVNFSTSLNYSYKNTYLLDATYTMDGSTVFGSNNRFSPFWVVGVGWNIHNAFNMDPDKVSLLKIAFNHGVVGNQGFRNNISSTIYSYDHVVNLFGSSNVLSTYGNPNLEWQNVTENNLNFSLGVLNNRLRFNLSMFHKKSDPLVTALDLAPSTGLTGHSVNTGYLENMGADGNISFSPIRRVREGIYLDVGISGRISKSEYGGFSNFLDDLNRSLSENANDEEKQIAQERVGRLSLLLERYKDGASQGDLWAVRSLGIDPATGREVYLTKEGLPSYEYNSKDEVIIGNKTPTLSGNISFNLRIKKFRIGTNFSYRFGGHVVNSALFEKVENISLDERDGNLDVAALEGGRWLSAGDVTRFKGIANFDRTRITSRFITEERTLTGGSVTASYRFTRDEDKWLDALGIQSLNIGASMNDSFRLTNLQVERGIQYPFAHRFSFNLSANF